MMKVMLVSEEFDALIDERYRAFLERDARATIWETFEVDPDVFARYEELRIALYEMVEEIKEEAKK